MATKCKTNAELVSDLMNYSPVGVVSQLFIMDAIGKYANKVASMSLEELTALFEQNGAIALIEPLAWHRAAIDIKKRLDAFYSRPL